MNYKILGARVDQRNIFSTVVSSKACSLNILANQRERTYITYKPVVR